MPPCPASEADRGPAALLALALLITALPARAQQPTAASVARMVDQHYNHLHSLQARYTERYQGMGMDRTESGTLILLKPGRMRWAYDRPAGKRFILDSHYAISYTPGDAQATRVPARRIDDIRSPLRFLLGHAQLSKELDHLSLAPIEGGYTLSGVARGALAGASQHVGVVVLTVASAGEIRALRLQEEDGASTTFNFTDEHENVETSPADFVFVPPPGVTVVDGPAL